MGGLEAFRQLQAIEPEVRAIVASGYSHDPMLSDHEPTGSGASWSSPSIAQALIDGDPRRGQAVTSSRTTTSTIMAPNSRRNHTPAGALVQRAPTWAMGMA